MKFEPGLTPQYATAGAQQLPDGTGVEYSVAELRPGARMHYDVKCKCMFAAPSACGSVKVTDSSQTPYMSEQSVEIVAAQAAKEPSPLGLKLVCDTNPARVGSEIPYTLTVTNNGTTTERNVRLSFVVPDSLGYVSSTGELKESRNEAPNIQFEPIMELRTGESATLKLRFRAMRAGLAEVTAEATSQEQSFSVNKAVSVF